MARPTVKVSDMDNAFAVDKVRLRGVTYVLTELPMSDYDKVITQATKPSEDGGPDEVDYATFNRLLLAKSLTVGGKKVDVDDLYSKGSRLVRELQRRAARLHSDPEPIEAEGDAADEGEADAES